MLYKTQKKKENKEIIYKMLLGIDTIKPENEKLTKINLQFKNRINNYKNNKKEKTWIQLNRLNCHWLQITNANIEWIKTLYQLITSTHIQQHRKLETIIENIGKNNRIKYPQHHTQYHENYNNKIKKTYNKITKQKEKNPNIIIINIKNIKEKTTIKIEIENKLYKIKITHKYKYNPRYKLKTIIIIKIILTALKIIKKNIKNQKKPIKTYWIIDQENTNYNIITEVQKHIQYPDEIQKIKK